MLPQFWVSKSLQVLVTSWCCGYLWLLWDTSPALLKVEDVLVLFILSKFVSLSSALVDWEILLFLAVKALNCFIRLVTSA